jgi:hypothetical protein
VASDLNGWDSRLQPWRYRPPAQVQPVAASAPALGLSFAVLLSGPVAPRPAALAVDMTVVLTTA